MRTAPFRLPRFVRSLVLALALFGTASASSAAVFVSVNFAPPPLPVYAQPLCPGPGYIWTPGYWAYGVEGYYWVPGTWVLAPFIGALWTPGYWGWSGAVYVWHPGYWGRHVGYYGGIDYGFGYFGTGYVGGYWRDRAFYYNTSVTHVDSTRVHYTYSRPVENFTASRVSFNGGRGGTTARPTAQERIAQGEAHRSATPMQLEHQRSASRDRGSLASVNHGSPRVAATQRASAFEGSELRGRAGGANAPRTEPSHVAGARTETQRSVESARRDREFGPPSSVRNGAAERERAAPRAAAPRIESRPEMHAQERGPEARAPSMQRPQAAPHRQAAPAPEMRAQNTPRPQAAPRMQPAPRPEMHAQGMARPQAAPRMQAAPRPEMHAQGQPRESRGGGGRHDEHRG